MRHKLTPRRMLIKAFHAASYVCPEAGRQAYRMQAEEVFKLNRGSDFLAVVRLNLTQRFLQEAGYDVFSDEPYKDVLGLEGGRQEFEAMMPEKYRTAEWLPSLKSQEPS